MSVKRTPLQSIVLQRDGKSYVPTIGEVFEFTKEEAADIERVNPDAFSSQATVNVEDVTDKAVQKTAHPAGKKAAKDEGGL